MIDDLKNRIEAKDNEISSITPKFKKMKLDNENMKKGEKEKLNIINILMSKLEEKEKEFNNRIEEKDNELNSMITKLAQFKIDNISKNDKMNKYKPDIKDNNIKKDID